MASITGCQKCTHGNKVTDQFAAQHTSSTLIGSTTQTAKTTQQETLAVSSVNRRLLFMLQRCLRQVKVPA